MVTGKTSQGDRAGLGQPVCPAGPTKFWGFLWLGLARAAPQLLPGAPLRLASAAPHPLPRERLGDMEPDTRTPAAYKGNRLAVPWNLRCSRRLTCLYKTPDLPRLLASDITGLHPELSLGSVPPTGQPAVLSTSGPWLPRGVTGSEPHLGTSAVWTAIPVPQRVGRQGPSAWPTSPWLSRLLRMDGRGLSFHSLALCPAGATPAIALRLPGGRAPPRAARRGPNSWTNVPEQHDCSAGTGRGKHRRGL